MEAFRLPRGTPEQTKDRDEAIEKANKEATLVPLSVLENSVELATLASQVVASGYKNSVSDAGVAGLTARACGLGAYYNVRINLPGLKDEVFKKKTLNQAEKLRQKLEKEVDKIEKLLDRCLSLEK